MHIVISRKLCLPFLCETHFLSDRDPGSCLAFIYIFYAVVKNICAVLLSYGGGAILFRF